MMRRKHREGYIAQYDKIYTINLWTVKQLWTKQLYSKLQNLGCLLTIFSKGYDTYLETQQELFRETD